jgi:hypothetical protein
LKSAIEAVLEQTSPRPSETRAVGCAVEYPEDPKNSQKRSSEP